MQVKSVLEAFRRLDIDRLRQNLDPLGTYSDVHTAFFLESIERLFEKMMGEQGQYIHRRFGYYPFTYKGINEGEEGYAFIDVECCCLLLLKLTIDNDIVTDIRSIPEIRTEDIMVDFDLSDDIFYHQLNTFRIYEEDKFNYDSSTRDYGIILRQHAINDLISHSQKAPLDVRFLKSWYNRCERFNMEKAHDLLIPIYRTDDDFRYYLEAVKEYLSWEKDIEQYSLFGRFLRTLDKKNSEQLELWGRLVYTTIEQSKKWDCPEHPLTIENGAIALRAIRLDAKGFEEIVYTKNMYKEFCNSFYVF